MAHAIAAKRAIAGAMRCGRRGVAAWKHATRCLEGEAGRWRGYVSVGAWNGPTCTNRNVRDVAWNTSWLTRHVSGSSVLHDAIQVPNMGESITEGTIASIDKEVGDAVDEDEVIAQIETDKVTIDVRAPAAGVIDKILVSVEDNVTVGQTIAEFTPGAAEKKEEAKQEETPADEKPETPAPPTPEPKAEKKEEKADKQATPPPEPTPTPPSPPTTEPEAEPSVSKGERTENRVAMSRLRRRVAERLKEAQDTYAMLTTFNEIDMTNLMNLRAAYKDEFMEVHGVKLGFMSAFVRAASCALNEIPAVNGVIDGDEIVYRHYHDVSIAVSTPRGLVVPVLRNVEKMSFADIEKGINTLGMKARDGSLSIDDMTGGTFTISNGGVYGSLLSTPIINMPQSAVLGMHSIQKRPMVINDEIKIRPMMYVALSYDHRLIDGREAVTFLKRIKEVVEDPRRLLLDV